MQSSQPLLQEKFSSEKKRLSSEARFERHSHQVEVVYYSNSLSRDTETENLGTRDQLV